MEVFDKLNIAKKLQAYHYFFRAFWDIGTPVVGDFPDLKTAAISFDKNGNCLQLLVNQTFWENLNEETRLFLICHEMCHIILQHGTRFSQYLGTPDASTMNIAADVVINEMLCDSFGFSRQDLNPELRDGGCWYDTVFKSENIEKNQSTEYYFNILKNRKSSTEEEVYYSIDSHQILDDQNQKEIEGLLSESNIANSLDKDFWDKIPQSEKTQSLFGSGDWVSVNANTVIKKKWESIIKNWERNTNNDSFKYVERWDRLSPRYSQIMNGDINLPTEAFILDRSVVKNKIDVFFFLDTSGSCFHLKDRFFKAAKSLNPKKFNVRLFCFDTVVRETTIKSNKIYGGGGTRFSIMEKYIQHLMTSEKIKYPHSVFVITDGYGDFIHPQFPKRWKWFLTHRYTALIPSESKTYMLSDFE